MDNPVVFFCGENGTGNVLVDTIMQMPGILKALNVQNEALNGKSATDELKNISEATFAGLKAINSKQDSESTSDGGSDNE